MPILKRIIIGIVLYCLFAVSLKAQIVSGVPPAVTITSISGVPVNSNDPINLLLNAEIDNAWDLMLAYINTDFAKYSDLNKLAKGFANANAYASRVATIQGYQDYSLFALTGGAMFGIQSPGFYINKDQIKKIREEIKENGDIYLGIGTGIAVANAGFNAGFIYPGLYVNLTYGRFKISGSDINKNLKKLNVESNSLEGFFYKSSLYGIGINQIILWPRTLVPGLVRWRGLSVGTGFYYSKVGTGLEIIKSLVAQGGAVSATTSGYTVTGALSIDPSFKLNIETTTMTIPLDITTSIRLLYLFNFSLGAGVDFNFGKSSIGLNATGDISMTITSPSDITANIVPGYLTIRSGAKDIEPSLINPRITTGIGFNLGAVKIDIPIAVYYDAGFSAGLTAGVVW